MKKLILKIKLWRLRRYMTRTQSDLKVDTYDLVQQANKIRSQIIRLSQ